MNAREQVILNINNEWNEFIEDLKTKPASEVIEKAYEIYTKEMFKNVIETGAYFDEKICSNLLELKYILDGLYCKWLTYDYTEADEMINFIERKFTK